jgi:hypothetical protein
MFEIPSRTDIVRCVVNVDVFTQRTQPLLFNAAGQRVFLNREYKSAA